MTAERRFTTSDFDYHLPGELIAQVPTGIRGESRLLVVRGARGRRVSGSGDGSPASPTEFEDRVFGELVSLVSPGDLLVLNTTRVRHARFLGTRPSGAPAEVLLIHPGTGGDWVALGKPGSAMKPGKRIRIGPDAEIETVTVLEDGNRVVRFVGVPAEEAIARYGRLPLPPYITRDPDATDEERYQTVYAEREGSVAAPTAGLHFTPDLLARLQAGGVAVAHLDLEVGPGTFKPVEGEEITAHPMHPERYTIPPALAEAVARTRSAGGAVWAVGTTVVRALESAADGAGGLRVGPGETTLMITPGYQFQVVDRLVTNFHLPRSTLLMLVAAFMGLASMRAAYAHAIAQGYRFYSYGDAMVVGRDWRLGARD